jgi:hypothetical protein
MSVACSDGLLWMPADPPSLLKSGRLSTAAEYSNLCSPSQPWAPAYKRHGLDRRRRSCTVPIVCIQKARVQVPLAPP